MGDNFPKPGGVFEERYQIESIIGRGGFAQIYKAEQIDLGRKVAIKVLNPGLRNQPGHGDSVSERFRREAKLVASLRDPHTIIMHDYGRTNDALLYMVFEYIDGQTLSEVVRQEGPLEPTRIVKILRQCLTSLQEAHAMGVLHRDIKPANIMVYEHIGRTDQVKVLDFGIAKSVLSGDDDATTSSDLTQSGMIVGTPRYMAPEQLRGTTLGPPTDLYSLGLVAYELLAGKKAITADSMVSIITRQVSDDVIALPDELGLSDNFRATIESMLQKSEQKRFQNAAEVLVALEKLTTEDLQTEEIPDVFARDTVIDQPGILAPWEVDYPSNTTVEPTPTGAMSAHPEIPAEDTSPSKGVAASTGDSHDLWHDDTPVPLSGIVGTPAEKSDTRWRGYLLVVLLLLGVLGLIIYFISPQPLKTDVSDDIKGGTQLKAENLAADHKIEAAARVAENHSMHIATVPAGARISLNDKFMGLSPVDIALAEVQFPATLSAHLEGVPTATISLDKPRQTVTLTLEPAVLEFEVKNLTAPPTSTTASTADNKPDSVANNAAESKPTPEPEPRTRPTVNRVPPEPKSRIRLEETDNHRPVPPESNHESTHNEPAEDNSSESSFEIPPLL